jgi:hypothetical protein
LKKKETALDILMSHERSRPTPAMEFITQRTTRPAYEALCVVIGRILKLPAAHETTRMVAHSLIAQIRYFGDPERYVSRLDPTILAGKTDEELARSIVSFSLAGPYPHEVSTEVAESKPRRNEVRTSPKKLHSVQP